MARYWKILYEGEELMQVWAGSKKEAEASARAVCIRTGRSREIDFARLQAQ
mgnify:CR=1 FL=1|jgi:hypothetical protein